MVATTSAFWARWRIKWSIKTIATLLLQSGATRTPTQGSWRPLDDTSVFTINIDRFTRRGNRRRRFQRNCNTVVWPLSHRPDTPLHGSQKWGLLSSRLMSKLTCNDRAYPQSQPLTALIDMAWAMSASGAGQQARNLQALFQPNFELCACNWCLVHTQWSHKCFKTRYGIISSPQRKWLVGAAFNKFFLIPIWVTWHN